MCAIILVSMQALSSIWAAGRGCRRHYCFLLPLQTKQALCLGNAGKCWYDKHSSRMQEHMLRASQCGSLEDRKKRASQATSRGVNIT